MRLPALGGKTPRAAARTEKGREAVCALVDDIDVKTYLSDAGGPPLLASVFQVYVDNSDPNAGYSNQTYQNVRIEGNVATPLLELKNTVYPWGGPYAYNPPLGNSYNFVFRNISLEGTQKYRSQILGWDANNGFHNIVLDNLRFNGVVVNQTNLSQYFDINSYVSGLTFTPTPGLFTLTPCRLIDTRLPAGPFGGPALAAGANRVFTVVGQCGIPAGAKAISSNATITQPTAPGFVVLFPGGAVPGVSNVNFRAGQTRANNAIVPLSAGGTLSVTDGQSSGTTHFILDVNGYFQ